jgi:hypothetical protein
MALSRRAKRFFTTEDTPYLVIVSRVEMNTMIKINTCIKRNAKFHLSLSYIYIYIYQTNYSSSFFGSFSSPFSVAGFCSSTSFFNSSLNSFAAD